MVTPAYLGISAVAESDWVGGGDTGNLAIVAPATAAGDLLVTVISDLAVGQSTAITPAPGFTLAGSVTSGNELLFVYSKRAQAADSGATFTFIVPPGSNPATGVMLCYQNAYGIEQVATNFSTAVSGPSSTTMTAATVTTSRANQLILEAFTWETGATGTGPSTVRLTGSGNPSKLLISEQTQSVAGTTPTRQATLTASRSWAVVTFSIYPNDAPNAPTLIGPVDGSTVNVGAVQRFFWDFSDPDPADSASQHDWRYTGDGGTTWTLVNIPSPLPFIDVAAGTFVSGTAYQWQARSYDAIGAVGPWSASFHFTGATPPAGPTISAPTADQVIGAATVNVAWTAPGTQQGYQVRLWPDSAGSANTSGSPIFDTGQVIDGSTFQIPVPLATTGVTRHVQVSVKVAGLWSAFVDRRFTVNYNPPPTPVVTLSENDSTITVFVATAAPGGGQLAAVAVDVQLSADGGVTWETFELEPSSAGLPTNCEWTFWTPAAGVDYLFRAVAYSSAGTTAYSSEVDVAVIDMGTPSVVPPLITQGGP